VKAFILAAGYGKRLQPYTENLPKALIKVQGLPMIEIVIKRLIKYGFDDIIINLHHFSDKIKDFIASKNYFDIKITFSEEKKLLDTGGAIKFAYDLIKGHSILVHNVDILTDINLEKFKKEAENKQADVLLAVKKRKTNRYLLFDQAYKLKGWKNIQTGETILNTNYDIEKLHPMAFSGIHLINNSTLELIKKYPEDKFSITTFYLKHLEKLNIYGFPHNSNLVMDLGKIDNLEIAQYLNLKKFL